MKLIPLTGKHGAGKFAMVDDEDYELLIQQNWQGFSPRDGVYYAHGNSSRKDGKKTLRMHRVIMGLKSGDEKVVDHIDHNGLNNQKSNLRICSNSENSRNRRVNKGKNIPFKGMTLHTTRKTPKLVVTINVDKKTIRLGRFPYTPEGEVAAAKCYDEAAKKYHKEFASLNFKD